VKVEGRPVSDSEEEKEEPDEAAEAAAIRDAELDGAQVERMESGRSAGTQLSVQEWPFIASWSKSDECAAPGVMRWGLAIQHCKGHP